LHRRRGAHTDGGVIAFPTRGSVVRRFLLLATAAIFGATPLLAQSVDRVQTARIIDEGMTHSEVMLTAAHLSDTIGPRLTNSPAMRLAEAWTQAKFAGWGLKNVHKDAFDFGRGWYIVSSSVRLVSPRPIQLTAIPIAWTPATMNGGTNGTISAPVIVAPIRRERDFDKWRGKLAGKIALVTLPNGGSEPGDPGFKRYTGEELAKLDRLKGDDMRQGSVILAAFLVNAANADKPLPRSPLPTKPVTTDPFAYSDEEE